MRLLRQKPNQCAASWMRCTFGFKGEMKKMRAREALMLERLRLLQMENTVGQCEVGTRR